MTQATMKVEEAAQLLGISRAAAYRAVREGNLPAIHIGRIVRIPRAPLEKMLNEGAKAPLRVANGN